MLWILSNINNNNIKLLLIKVYRLIIIIDCYLMLIY